MTGSNITQLVYYVDRENNIAAVNGPWDELAEQHDAESAKSNHIVGRPLRHYISDSPTKMLMTTLFDLTRIKKQPVRRQYRCDTPTKLRLMEMTLTQLDEEQIEVRHRLVKVSNRITPIHYSTTLKRKTIKHCSMCQRLYFNEQWAEADNVAQQQPHLLKDLFLIHTVCPVCANPDNLRHGHFVGEF